MCPCRDKLYLTFRNTGLIIMRTTRTAPVTASWLHADTDAYIVISSTMLEREISTFEKALSVDIDDMVLPDNDVAFLSVVELLEPLLGESVGAPCSDGLNKLVSCLEHTVQQLLMYRLQQLRSVIVQQKQHRYGDTYLVSPCWHRRWLDLIAGRMLHADVICLDVDVFQP